MAFFTRVNLNVPMLPPDDFNFDSSSSLIHHRRHASEPAIIGSSPSPLRAGVYSVSKDVSAINVALISARTESGTTTMIKNNANSVSTETNNINIKEPTTRVTNVAGGSTKVADKTNKIINETEEEKDETNGESKRYEYVVDRVLGVEV